MPYFEITSAWISVTAPLQYVHSDRERGASQSPPHEPRVEASCETWRVMGMTQGRSGLDRHNDPEPVGEKAFSISECASNRKLGLERHTSRTVRRTNYSTPPERSRP